MNTDQKRPMSEDQLEYVKNEIKKTYLYLIGHTTYNPEVIEVMKWLLWLTCKKGTRQESRGKCWFDFGVLVQHFFRII